MSIHPSDLHVGDCFWESGHYGNVQMCVTSKPTQNQDGLWEWTAEHVITKDLVHYAWSSSGYGPSLYWEPAYEGVPTF